MVDRQFNLSPILFLPSFVKYNVHQIFRLYGIMVENYHTYSMLQWIKDHIAKYGSTQGIQNFNSIRVYILYHSRLNIRTTIYHILHTSLI